MPQRVGLYDPAFEHDACGTGFVASIDGIKSHQIVQWAVQCVCNVTHRGAVSADAKTGDGAGILTQLPHQFFGKILTGLKQPTPPPGDLAVGMAFLSSDPARYAQARRSIEEALARQGIPLLAWREVPVDASVLGDSAKASLPRIMQVLMRRPEAIQADVFERALFLSRRRIEKAFAQATFDDCYIPSWSSRVIVYKGLLVAPQLAQFYHDLRDTDFTSAIAVFHQRYSTNTFPNWFLAQPFRFLGHNGEINTLRGNRNWMSAREPELSSPLWNKELK
jgi:glutamate synthase domain-containing protein 1